MNPDEEARITRWIDGELDDSEVADLLAAHPELQREKEAAQEVGRLLREELDTGEKIPFPEFFNRQVQRHIEEEQELEERKRAYEAIPEGNFFSWFTFTRNAAAAAFLVLVGVFIGKAFFDSRVTGSEIVYTYAPDPAVQATQYYSESANATVLELDGLSAIPADKVITGRHTASYRPSDKIGTTTLFSVNTAEPAFILVTDGNQIPTIYEVNPPIQSGRTF